MKKIKPYYHDDGITLYNGNALEVLDSLGDLAFDITVTSPPYNMGIGPGGGKKRGKMYRPSKSVLTKGARFFAGYDTHTDSMPQDIYDDWQRQCLSEMWRVSRFAVYYNHRPRVEHGRLRTPLSNNYGDVVLRQIIIWYRRAGIDVNLTYYGFRHEWIMLFAKDDFKLRDHSSSAHGDVWDLGIDRSRIDHPATFPESLPLRAIYTSNATSVLDPFCGSGTTLIAARKSGIQAVGIEQSRKYCDIAVARLINTIPLIIPETPTQGTLDL